MKTSSSEDILSFWGFWILRGLLSHFFNAYSFGLSALLLLLWALGFIVGDLKIMCRLF